MKSKVEVVCTTDDPIDTLEYHQKIKEDHEFDVKVLPSFRPDKGLEINRDGDLGWVEKLADVSGMSIDNYGNFLDALSQRIEFFHSVGGRVSDHALDSVVYVECTKQEANEIFAKALKGEKVSLEEEKNINHIH